MTQAVRQVPEGGKARRAYLVLRDAILRGDHAPGDTLPGEVHLAGAHGVSRVTIRRALDALAADGLIARRAGAGTVVLGRSVPPSGIVADFATLMPELVRMGQATTARLLSCSYVEPPPAVAAALGHPAQVQRAVRVRMVGQVPFSYLVTHVPADIALHFSEADLATTPLFRLLERSGVQVDHAHQSLSATLAGPEVAEALDVAPGSALMALTRVVQDTRGRGVEHLSALYRPDRFRLEMTLNRVGGAGARHWAPVMDVAE
ncbi:MAG: GntR family transcriptional regulator [Alkalilacustris sp.]